MNNLFDLKDTSDLPEETRKDLSCLKRRETVESRILNFFTNGPSQISIDMIIVAYYRKYKVFLTRNRVAGEMHRLRKKGLIKKGKSWPAVYFLDKKPLET